MIYNMMIVPTYFVHGGSNLSVFCHTKGLIKTTLFLYELYYNLEGASFHLIAQKVIVPIYFLFFQMLTVTILKFILHFFLAWCL
jgi:hypothetical protein